MCVLLYDQDGSCQVLDMYKLDVNSLVYVFTRLGQIHSNWCTVIDFVSFARIWFHCQFEDDHFHPIITWNQTKGTNENVLQHNHQEKPVIRQKLLHRNSWSAGTVYLMILHFHDWFPEITNPNIFTKHCQKKSWKYWSVLSWLWYP